MHQDNSILMNICRDIQAAGGRIFYAGGYVRDYLRGAHSVSQDIDLEVFGIKRGEVISTLESYGEVKLVGRSFPVIKLKGHNEWDFTLPPAASISFTEACKRRDFTINAMLMDVSSGEVIDIYGGQEDLKKGLIRHTVPDVFQVDPLRVYRAAQLAARLSFSIHPETMELMKLADLSFISKERIYREFKQLLLLSPEPSLGLRILHECGALAKVHPLLYSLIGCRQSPENHPEGDVWEHTLQVVDQAALLKEESGDPEVLMFAALLHDVGKPMVTRDKNGKITAYGHDLEGAKLTRRFLYEMNASRRIIESTAELVREHMHPVLLYKQRDQVTDKAVRKLLNRVNVKELLLLSQADFNGRGMVRDYKPVRNWLLERIEKLGLKPNERIKPLLKGKDLLELGFEPGEQFSQMLDFAFELQNEGIGKEEILKKITDKYC